MRETSGSRAARLHRTCRGDFPRSSTGLPWHIAPRSVSAALAPHRDACFTRARAGTRLALGFAMLRAAPEPGDVLDGKYRVDAVIGRGGMSVVYRATHLDLDRPVALKVLSPEAVKVPEYVARLKHEARAVATIKSEHVVRVFDVGEIEESQTPYLVMELLTGCDLAMVLAKRGPLPIGFAVMCIMQACEALAEAHAAGLVHRDLKPANLFLTHAVDGSPCVKVVDFGISRMRHGLAPVTDPGIVLGTPSYMAPEQMEAGGEVGPRSDIWALGAILFELLTGRSAHKGESLPQIFVRIMRSRPPRPSSVRAGIPASLDAIVARCLAVDPNDRYDTVADLARALAPFGDAAAGDDAARIARVFARCRAQASPVLGFVATRPRLFSAVKRVAAGAGAILVGAAAGLVLFEPRGEPESAAAAAPPPPRATQDAGAEALVRVSTSVQRAAFSGQR